jgi:OOP family OmpA-OmpF porin
MKKLFTYIALSISTAVMAQADFNQWSISANFGGLDGAAPVRVGGMRIYNSPTVGGDVRYMFNNRFGIMGSARYGRFNFPSGDVGTNYVGVQIHGVVNAGDIIKLGQLSERLGLLVHGGTGFGALWQPGFYPEDFTSPFFNKADETLLWSFGIQPQVKLTEKFALTSDLTFNFHGRQDRTFDFQRFNPRRTGINGYFLTATVGATYYIGKKEKHADWVPTVYGGGDEAKLVALEERVKQLENRVKDVEDELEARAIVDTDGDGVPDEFDACPDTPGVWAQGGCPDTDGDGIADHIDECPETPGTFRYQGCPDVPRAVKEVLDRAFSDIQFELNSDKLLSSSNRYLDEVVLIMTENPEYKLKISGHTCDLGSAELNMDLSRRRAESVKNYIQGKGIDRDRIIAVGFGQTRPVADNNTNQGKERNRRVEFLILQ